MGNLLPPLSPAALRQLAESPIAGDSVNLTDALYWAAEQIAALESEGRWLRSQNAILRHHVDRAARINASLAAELTELKMAVAATRRSSPSGRQWLEEPTNA